MASKKITTKSSVLLLSEFRLVFKHPQTCAHTYKHTEFYNRKGEIIYIYYRMMHRDPLTINTTYQTLRVTMPLWLQTNKKQNKTKNKQTQTCIKLVFMCKKCVTIRSYYTHMKRTASRFIDRPVCCAVCRDG
jgi:hypothetical protein